MESFATAAVAAGQEILEKRKDRLNPVRKADGSPVTDADLRAEEVIRTHLGAALPGLPIIGEESYAALDQVPLAESFILVDPLDGTRDFLDGSPEFTVNIALIEKGRPVAGALHAPALGRLFLGSIEDGAWEIAVPTGRFEPRSAPRRKLHVRTAPATGATLLESRSHREAATEHLVQSLAPFERRSTASSLKFALLAAGEGDLYARGVSLNEWDIAAGDAILSAAGGAVLTLDDERVFYGNVNLKAPPFVALGDPALRERVRRFKASKLAARGGASSSILR
ncbi:MAG: 3'(2'),5'-bisphosphate nucleotidase CysQ [Hyphomicrobiales bacterium]|nr:3'(2'),5'-bisphosphate nucleotidase CysQ [Hyphomicrobiales bacterium]